MSTLTLPASMTEAPKMLAPMSAITVAYLWLSNRLPLRRGAMSTPIFVLLLAAWMGLVTPSAMANGTIFAVVSITNKTDQTIMAPFSGASTPQVWGTEGNTLDLASELVVMPDGTPPRILGPGQTMLFGTKSNGKFLATTGTGGSLEIAGSKITWSAPWAFFNGAFPADVCNSKISPESAGSVFSSGMMIIGGPSNSGNNTCNFSFGIVAKSMARKPLVGSRQAMSQDESISWPTSCPNHMTCIDRSSSLYFLESPDRSVRLAIVRDITAGRSPAGGRLVLRTANGSVVWTSAPGIVVATMQSNGEFVFYNAAGQAVWTAPPGNHPRAVLTVAGSGMTITDPSTHAVLFRAGK